MHQLSAYCYDLSVWASKNILKARLLLGLGHFVLAALALSVGAGLGTVSGNISVVLQVVLLLAATFIAFLYQSQNRKNTQTWTRRKKLEGGLLACGILLLILAGNGIREKQPVLAIPAAQALTRTEAPVKQATTVKLIRKAFRKYVDWSLTTKILVAILLFAAAVGVGLLIVSFSCSLACSGYQTLGALLLIMGSAGIIIGWGFLYAWLFRGKAKQEARDARRAARSAARTGRNKNSY